jgi:hypothetical protein
VVLPPVSQMRGVLHIRSYNWQYMSGSGDHEDRDAPRNDVEGEGKS